MEEKRNEGFIVEKLPWYKRTWFVILMLIFFWPVGLILMWVHKKFPLAVRIIISIVIALGLVFQISMIGAFMSAPTVAPTTTVVDQEDISEPVQSPEAQPAEKEPDMTLGQKNAMKSAESYIDIMAFSYTGLIEQLEYEGYSTEEATFAADHCGADWMKEAEESAKSYMDTMSFSRDGLIEQLLYEGFTQEQAEHGVQSVGYES